MALSTRQKTWAIIAADLVIVLLVYGIYSQVRVIENSSERRQDGINYELTVRPPENESISIEFSLTSRRRSPYTVQMPDGVTLMLSDGQKTIFWRGQLDVSHSVNIPAGGERGWSRTITIPDDAQPPLYVGFHIDEDRQTQVRVPD